MSLRLLTPLVTTILHKIGTHESGVGQPDSCDHSGYVRNLGQPLCQNRGTFSDFRNLPTSAGEQAELDVNDEIFEPENTQANNVYMLFVTNP